MQKTLPLPLQQNEIPQKHRHPGQWLVAENWVFRVNEQLQALPIALRKEVDALMDAALSHIRRKSVIAYDVCAEKGAIYDNTSHMTWFKEAVAERLTTDFKKYRELAPLFNSKISN